MQTFIYLIGIILVLASLQQKMVWEMIWVITTWLLVIILASNYPINFSEIIFK